MGNTPSSEKPVRAPQKLSKPRVGNHASNNTPSSTKDSLNRLNNTRSNVSIHSQRQNSYNFRPPPLPHEGAEPPHIAVTGVPSELGVAEEPEMDNEGPLSRRSKRLSGLIRSVSSKSQPESVTRGQSTGSTPRTFIGMVRPKSMVQASNKAPSLASQSRPVSSDGVASGDSSITRQQSSSEIQRPDETLNSPEAGTQVVIPEQATTPRLGLERSPYLPRRSSFGQTPGAATRLLSLPTEPQSLTATNLRRSFPPTSGSANYHHPRAVINRRQSMPVASVSMPIAEGVRASTPSEGDYRQLGGIRFGSLRITNDTSIPAQEGTPDRGTTVQWPFTPDYEEGQSNELGSAAPIVINTAKITAETQNPDGDAALEQQRAEQLPSVLPLVVRTASSEAQESMTDSSDTSNSSENRSSDEHDQTGQLSVPSSHPDSGYASSSSLHSETKATGKTTGDGQPNDESPKSFVDQDDPSNPHTDSTDGQEISQEPISLSMVEDQANNVQRQPSLRARGSAMLSSLLSRKSRDSRPMEQSSSRSRASSTHSRGTSLPDAVIQDEDFTDAEASPKKSDDRVNQASKLKRLLKSRRRSLPQESTYIVQDTTPMPSDAEDKLREHGFQIIQTTGEKPTLRMEQSRDTLKTIISVGSTEDKDEVKHTRSPRSKHSGFFRDQPTDSSPSVRKPSNINRTKSLLYPKPSSRHAKSTLRKSMPVVIKPTTAKVDPVDEDLAETVQIWGYEAHMASIASIRHMAGNSAFDQAFVPMSRDNGAYPGPVNMPQPPQERSMHKNHPGWTHRPLRTRYSAPDFLETVCEPASPGGIDSTQQKPPKTPPPVSLRTRGSKKSRRRARTQHHSHRPPPQYVPPVPHMGMQESVSEHDQDFSSPRRLSQSLRSFPVQPQKPPMGSHQSYGGHNSTHNQMHFSKPRYHVHHSSWDDPRSGYHHSPGAKVHHGYNTAAHRAHPIQSS